jgi:hypothetical protein
MHVSSKTTSGKDLKNFQPYLAYVNEHVKSSNLLVKTRARVAHHQLQSVFLPFSSFNAALSSCKVLGLTQARTFSPSTLLST